jgi:hypothetical protein
LGLSTFLAALSTLAAEESTFAAEESGFAAAGESVFTAGESVFASVLELLLQAAKAPIAKTKKNFFMLKNFLC